MVDDFVEYRKRDICRVAVIYSKKEAYGRKFVHSHHCLRVDFRQKEPGPRQFRPFQVPCRQAPLTGSADLQWWSNQIREVGSSFSRSCMKLWNRVLVCVLVGRAASVEDTCKESGRMGLDSICIFLSMTLFIVMVEEGNIYRDIYTRQYRTLYLHT